MKHRIFAVALVVVAGLLFGSPTAGGQAADQAGGVTFTGTILDAKGEPLAGATVEVARVRFGRGGTLTPVVFATTETTADGRYAVDAEVPGNSSADSPVEVMVTATAGSDAVHHVVLLDPAATGGAFRQSLGSTSTPAEVPVDLQLTRGEIGTSTQSPSTSRTPGRELALAAAAGDAVEPVPPGTTYPDDDVPVLVPGRGESSCPSTWSTVWTPNLDQIKRRHLPVQRVTARAHSTQRYEWDSTNNTKASIAFTGDGGNYAGGITGSKENASGLGMKMELGNGQSKILEVQWEYMRYTKRCVSPCHSCGQYYDLQVYQWRPHRRTTGSRKPDSIPVWSCTAAHTVSMAVETWVARSSSVYWEGWFSLGGVKLDDRQTNSGSHKLTIIPDSGERSPKICGDNDIPSEASRVKEKVD